MRLVITLCLVLNITTVYSKPLKSEWYSISFGNINATYPITGFPGLFSQNFHPYIQAKTGFQLKQNEKNCWQQTINMSYFFHRFVQHGIPITTETVYQRIGGKKWKPYAALGAGYLHAIPSVDRYKLDNNGNYKKIASLGRPQATFSLSLGTDLHTAKHIWFAEYKMLFQTPFVKSYVPLLPYGIIQIGLKLPVKNADKGGIK